MKYKIFLQSHLTHYNFVKQILLLHCTLNIISLTLDSKYYSEIIKSSFLHNSHAKVNKVIMFDNNGIPDNLQSVSKREISAKSFQKTRWV